MFFNQFSIQWSLQIHYDDFREKIKGTVIDEDEVMISLDVVSLFPSIPVDTAIKIIESKWTHLQNYTHMTKGLFLKILTFCIKDNRYFQYKNNIYVQKKGLPMGSAASPIVADIVMEELLDKCLANCDIRPKILTKYVDDLFGIIKTSAIDKILTKFNSFDANIKFTIEKEENGSLPYLDMRLSRDKNNILIDWYQKPTSSGRLLNYYSKHPKRIIKNTAHNFIERVINTSDKRFHKQNKQKIIRILQDNSFPQNTINQLLKRRIQTFPKDKEPRIYKSVIYVPKLSERFENSECIDKSKYKIAHKTSNTLQSLFTNTKSKVGKLDKSNVIYKIECNGDGLTQCPKIYIGTTKNKLKSRLAGHKSDIKLRNRNTNQKTALAEHCAREKHEPDLEGVRVIDNEINYNKRLTLETLHIINTTTTNRMNHKADIEGCASNYRLLVQRMNKVQ
ncbi:uncharacterized protein LOC142235821 [Haematobia irritans]|uniref:uncharacterized protein LOC142235821 n=1 Tax=Haematobia irritans TaxID=7368 RepID=UPI003F4FF6B8